jgi:hypothetical protein
VNNIYVILFVMLSMLSILVSLGLYDIYVTVDRVNKKADEISNATHIVELELKHQIEVVQSTLNKKAG